MAETPNQSQSLVLASSTSPLSHSGQKTAHFTLLPANNTVRRSNTIPNSTTRFPTLWTDGREVGFVSMDDRTGEGGGVVEPIPSALPGPEKARVSGTQLFQTRATISIDPYNLFPSLAHCGSRALCLSTCVFVYGSLPVCLCVWLWGVCVCMLEVGRGDELWAIGWMDGEETGDSERCPSLRKLQPRRTPT